MIEFHIVPGNAHPDEEMTHMHVMVQVTLGGSEGPKGERYITEWMSGEQDVIETFARIRENLDAAEQRALATLREDKP